MDFNIYRQPTKYEGVFKYEAPDGCHWESCGTNFGKIIWGGLYLYNPYVIVEDNETDTDKDS